MTVDGSSPRTTTGIGIGARSAMRSSGNPATVYRSRLILQSLGEIDSDAVVLEIGCGQGEFALLLAETYPQADVRGIDNSAEGVMRASPDGADSRMCRVTFAQRDLSAEGDTQ